ncbi:reverse transcriptase [Plakobranchus ocellatus]|uniref:Reverse transcriptase n=1 Tax=Plakobranchus ocellatus TaxID=259542 RepID=A0AAV3ZE90_9GAST|nr:reverse transcriptase [Plakobranchus ocellatus]
MEKATGILVATLWPTQPFFPILERETNLPPKHARRIPSPSQKVDWWTKRQYEHNIKKWTAYAERVRVDCTSPPVAQAVNFLAELYTSGASFSALCPARSALSCFLHLRETKETFGNLHVVKKLMKGVFENKPSILLEDRVSVWDTNAVL